jgi:DNA-binding Xre family transcriptional regulator
MVNIGKLRGRIIERGYDIPSLADAIGVSRSTFYRRIETGGEDFRLREIDAMKRALDLSIEDCMAIFFEPSVAKSATA